MTGLLGRNSWSFLEGKYYEFLLILASPRHERQGKQRGDLKNFTLENFQYEILLIKFLTPIES